MRYDPYAHAETLGIEVRHLPITTANGKWLPEHDLVILRHGMKTVWDRSTLAHEMGHVILGHRDDRPKHEVQADRYAAEQLIDYDECVSLLKWAPDLASVAAELEVTNRLLRVYLNVHRLTGPPRQPPAPLQQRVG